MLLENQKVHKSDLNYSLATVPKPIDNPQQTPSKQGKGTIAISKVLPSIDK